MGSGFLFLGNLDLALSSRLVLWGWRFLTPRADFQAPVFGTFLATRRASEALRTRLDEGFVFPGILSLAGYVWYHR